MPLKLALGVRGTVAGHRLGALEGGGGVPPPLPMHPCPSPTVLLRVPLGHLRVVLRGAEVCGVRSAVPAVEAGGMWCARMGCAGGGSRGWRGLGGRVARGAGRGTAADPGRWGGGGDAHCHATACAAKEGPSPPSLEGRSQRALRLQHSCGTVQTSVAT